MESCCPAQGSILICYWEQDNLDLSVSPAGEYAGMQPGIWFMKEEFYFEKISGRRGGGFVV